MRSTANVSELSNYVERLENTKYALRVHARANTEPSV